MTNEIILVAIAAVVAVGYAARARFGTTPIPFSLALLTAGTVTQGILTGWLSGLVAFGIAGTFCVFLIFTRLLNRTNTFAFPALIAFIPLAHWWVLVPGFVIAAGVAVGKYLKANNLEDMKRLTTQTALMGMSNQMSDIADMAEDIEGRVTDRTNLFLSLSFGLVFSILSEVVLSALL